MKPFLLSDDAVDVLLIIFITKNINNAIILNIKIPQIEAMAISFDTITFRVTSPIIPANDSNPPNTINDNAVKIAINDINCAFV